MSIALQLWVFNNEPDPHLARAQNFVAVCLFHTSVRNAFLCKHTFRVMFANGHEMRICVIADSPARLLLMLLASLELLA